MRKGHVLRWRLFGTAIHTRFRTGTFAAGLRLLNAVGDAAEAANHHPDIDIRWRKVTIALTTHDAGGLTQKDFDLAAQIDEILG